LCKTGAYDKGDEADGSLAKPEPLPYQLWYIQSVHRCL
jgi:hypothetical protein